MSQPKSPEEVTHLPGMEDRDFDHCTCGLGWPMGDHHNWDCPAHCICGTPRSDVDRKHICAYHAGATGKIPVGPSVMTERWDLENEQEKKDELQQDVQIVVCDTEGEASSRLEGEEASRETSLS